MFKKNVASKVFSNKRNLEGIEVKFIKSLERNLKRLMVNSEDSATGLYLDRIEPLSGKKLFDSLEDYDLDLVRLKN